MCGIAGYAGAQVPDRARLKAMCDVIAHRGPDEEGYFVGDRVALGMRRLSIIDLAGGQQPIFNEDGTVAVVYNGEIYNFGEIRAGLEARGHIFKTGTDTECIVHLYEEQGERCCASLRGMFAFALWDERRRQLLLARDRAGKKPLYYRLTPDGIWFGSELKALLAAGGMGRSVELTALHHYLTYGYVPAPESILSGVRKLPPAHTLTWHDGIVSERRYWSLSFSAKTHASEGEAVEALRELIREATRIRLISDRPLGAFLSGGVDSSIVVAAMAEASTEPVRTFSIGFEDARFDERSYARLVAERFGTRHEELVVSPHGSDVADLLPRLVWHYDEPFADSSAIPSFALAELARREVVVALNGDGGDESFAGYDRYVAQKLAARIPAGGPVSRLAHRGVDALPSGAHRSRTRKVKRFLTFALSPPTTRYAEVMSVFTNRDKEFLYSDEMREAVAGDDAYRVLAAAQAVSDALDPVDAVLAADVATYLPGDLLVKMDIATMAHSLEARSPLLDHKVMEFAASLPASMKIRGRSGKWILKQAGRGWLPDAVLDRPKMGFGVPVAAWLRTELRDLAHDALCDHTARHRPYFDPGAVEQLLDEHEAGADHSAKLWALLCFELWHRRFIDGRRPVSVD
ncbi:MAG TPA: asparagine synthase (glutamine-hydrolyzing) [Actinomycetota bacterium]|nr:asparagine synthase (glutamine-hydrolyzing) [Actinomycetota bacterium]